MVIVLAGIVLTATGVVLALGVGASLPLPWLAEEGPWDLQPSAAVTPPTTLGMLRVVNFALPGSTRSGEKARKKSRPTFMPDSWRSGRISSSVVPG